MKEWAKLMLEMDLKSQSASIWTEGKSGLQKEKEVIEYQLSNYEPSILTPDPCYYNGKIVDTFLPTIIK